MLSKSVQLCRLGIGFFLLLNFCHTVELSPIIEIASLQDWDHRIQNGNETLIVAQFYVPWCGYCRYMKPEFVKIAAQHSNDTVMFLNVDADEQQSIAWRMGIRSVPTYKYFKNGRTIDSITTWHASVIRDLINRLKT